MGGRGDAARLSQQLVDPRERATRLHPERRQPSNPRARPILGRDDERVALPNQAAAPVRDSLLLAFRAYLPHPAGADGLFGLRACHFLAELRRDARVRILRRVAVFGVVEQDAEDDGQRDEQKRGPGRRPARLMQIGLGLHGSSIAR